MSIKDKLLFKLGILGLSSLVTSSFGAKAVENRKAPYKDSPFYSDRKWVTDSLRDKFKEGDSFDIIQSAIEELSREEGLSYQEVAISLADLKLDSEAMLSAIQAMAKVMNVPEKDVATILVQETFFAEGKERAQEVMAELSQKIQGIYGKNHDDFSAQGLIQNASYRTQKLNAQKRVAAKKNKKENQQNGEDQSIDKNDQDFNDQDFDEQDYEFDGTNS